MRRLLAFSNRTFKEVLRDPLNLAFGLGFPLVLLLVLSIIQKNIPVELFTIENLIPGIVVFGLSFMSLFSAALISKDRSSALLLRLYTTPLKATDFILGYLLPLIPIALAQTIICYGVAFILGLPISVNVIYAILLSIPMALFHIALGLMCGSCMNERQVGGLCGALLCNLNGWLSGAWFDLNLLGKGFKEVAYCFPFAHAVDVGRAVLIGNYNLIFPSILWVSLYAVGALVLAIVVFVWQMKRQ